MQWFGPSRSITTEEASGGLVFTITTIQRKIDLAIPIAVAGIAAGFLYAYPFGASLALAFAVSWLLPALFGKHKPTILHADDFGLRVDDTHYRWPDFHTLEYRPGGEDESQGLWLSGKGWFATKCLLPNINRKQTEEILSAIFNHFPDAPLAPKPESLFTRVDKLIFPPKHSA